MQNSWDKIIGHRKNIEHLKHLAETGRMPHALLFYGTDGIGKRQIAEVFAAAVLCKAGKRPCGICESCRALFGDESVHPDYFFVAPEVHGKSTRAIRIEQIRKLETELSRLPVLSARRAVIIDNADLMNEAAANSLLKTLEEPAGEAVFILIAPSKESLLPTIVSRCMPISFGVLKMAEVIAVLKQKGIAEEIAGGVAALAGGSAGKALSLLEENKELPKDVMAVLSELNRFDIERIFQEGQRLAELERDGFAEWLWYLKLILRDLLVLISGGTNVMNVALGNDLATLLTYWNGPRVFAAMKLVNDFERRINTSNVNIKLQAPALLMRLQRITEED